MSYQSVDTLQRALADSIFSNRQDVKKAAGRALGTIVELITFYIFREWGVLPGMSIERGLAEFGNDRITHNVEFGIHPIIQSATFTGDIKPPITTSKILKQIKANEKLASLSFGGAESIKSNQLYSSQGILRNACTLLESNDKLLTANIRSIAESSVTIDLSLLKYQPYAMIECKRVGVEEGIKKGPTTIEKAKQGAYVAKHVSALQKIRGRDGELYGVMPMEDGTFEVRELKEELRRLIYDANQDELKGFILTIGIVSNHGNWFTADDPNKELLVLKQSYDWLMFLTDAAIGEFVEDTILSNDQTMAEVKRAFSDSYASGESGKNQFTKVKISKSAHDVLIDYFHTHIARIESSWFNILSPKNVDIQELKQQLKTLREKMY